jgi:hypothetical protein
MAVRQPAEQWVEHCSHDEEALPKWAAVLLGVTHSMQTENPLPTIQPPSLRPLLLRRGRQPCVQPPALAQCHA